MALSQLNFSQNVQVFRKCVSMYCSLPFPTSIEIIFLWFISCCWDIVKVTEGPRKIRVVWFLFLMRHTENFPMVLGLWKFIWKWISLPLSKKDLVPRRKKKKVNYFLLVTKTVSNVISIWVSNNNLFIFNKKMFPKCTFCWIFIFAWVLHCLSKDLPV